MICHNKFLIDLCELMLTFLRSDLESTEIFGKNIKKMYYRTGSSGCIVNLRIMEARMIYKPNNDFSGNDDGATVILKLPFHDIKESKSLDLNCYFSRKGQESFLTYNQDVVKPSNRVIYNISSINNDLDILPNNEELTLEPQ